MYFLKNRYSEKVMDVNTSICFLHKNILKYVFKDISCSDRELLRNSRRLTQESWLHCTFSNCYHSMVLVLFFHITLCVREDRLIAPQVHMMLSCSNLKSINFS